MTKLTIIGAGSTVFTKNIVVDLLTIDQFKTIEIALMDIDKNRLIKILMHYTSMEIPIFNVIFKDEKINYYNKTEVKFENLNGINFLKPNNKKFPYLNILQKYKINDTFFQTLPAILYLIINSIIFLDIITKEKKKS